MRQLIFSPKSVADLDEIYDYTEEKWGWEQAGNYISGIRSDCEALSRASKQGRALGEITPGYQALSFRSHFIIYKESRSRLLSCASFINA